MSRVFKRGDTWFADFSNERRKRVKKSLRGAATKREAEGLLAELVAQVNRRRLGLEAGAVSLRSTVWDLAEWWLKNRCPKASQHNERKRLEKHLEGSEIGAMAVAHVRPGHFEAWFSALERPADPKARALSPASINHLRSKLRTAFERARREDLFSGKNPLQETKLRRVLKTLHQTLSAEEVPRVLAKVPPQWRGFVAAAVYMGLRKGEIAGLRKADVDLPTMTARVCRSYDRETTKGGHADLLPIFEVMRPYLVTALKTPGPLLFGDTKGRMRKRHSKPDVTLRRALAGAELVSGFRLSCRACAHDGKPHVEVVTGRPAVAPKCPVCKRQKLWVSPVPRHVRFHDLRHSTATILLRAGEDAHRVQKLMRHKSFDTTSKTYAHLVVEDLRQAQRAFGPVPDPAQADLPLNDVEKEAVAK